MQSTDSSSSRQEPRPITPVRLRQHAPAGAPLADRYGSEDLPVLARLPDLNHVTQQAAAVAQRPSAEECVAHLPSDPARGTCRSQQEARPSSPSAGYVASHRANRSARRRAAGEGQGEWLARAGRFLAAVAMATVLFVVVLTIKHWNRPAPIVKMPSHRVPPAAADVGLPELTPAAGTVGYPPGAPVDTVNLDGPASYPSPSTEAKWPESVGSPPPVSAAESWGWADGGLPDSSAMSSGSDVSPPSVAPDAAGYADGAEPDSMGYAYPSTGIAPVAAAPAVPGATPRSDWPLGGAPPEIRQAERAPPQVPYQAR